MQQVLAALSPSAKAAAQLVSRVSVAHLFAAVMAVHQTRMAVAQTLLAVVPGQQQAAVVAAAEPVVLEQQQVAEP